MCFIKPMKWKLDTGGIYTMPLCNSSISWSLWGQAKSLLCLTVSWAQREHKTLHVSYCLTDRSIPILFGPQYSDETDSYILIMLYVGAGFGALASCPSWSLQGGWEVWFPPLTPSKGAVCNPWYVHRLYLDNLSSDPESCRCCCCCYSFLIYFYLVRNQEQLPPLFSWQKDSKIQCSSSPSSQLSPTTSSHLWTQPLSTAMDLIPRRAEGWTGASAGLGVL